MTENIPIPDLISIDNFRPKREGKHNARYKVDDLDNQSSIIPKPVSQLE